MANETLSNKVNLLFEKDQWLKARKLLEEERENDPTDHWVLTQLGVTFYETKQYEEALKMFTASFQIVKDCPLTLWNAAGALSSLGRHKEAIPIYVWLLKAKTSVNKDPCWESKKWSDALKTDCVYRLGLCFEYLDKRETAEHCYIQYLTLVATGVKGTYSIDDVLSRVHRLGGEAGPEEKTRDLQNAIKSTLMAVEPNSTKDRASGDLLRLDSSDLVPELLVASKR